MNRFEKEYVAHFSNGTKQSITADSDAEANEQANALCPADATVSFITNAGGDIPFTYDWDKRLNKWQGNLF